MSEAADRLKHRLKTGTLVSAAQVFAFALKLIALRNRLTTTVGRLRAQVEQLERQVAELSKPVTDVTDEEAKASFTVWNGWIAYALEWEELDDAQQKQWKDALIAARAATKG